MLTLMLSSLRIYFIKRVKIIGILFLGMLLGCLMLATFILIISTGFRRFIVQKDFRAYYTAGKILVSSERKKLYNLRTQFIYQKKIMPEVSDMKYLAPFRNPPFVALPFAVLSLLSLEWAYTLMFIGNLILFYLVWRLSVTILALKDRLLKVILFLALMSYFPVWYTLVLGQVSLALVVGMLAAWKALQEKRELQAGMWLSLLLIKPQYIIVPLLLFAWKKQFRVLTGIFLGAISFGILSYLLVGYQGLMDYSRFLTNTLQWTESFAVNAVSMQTWRGFVELLVGTQNTPFTTILWLLGDILILVILFSVWKGKFSTNPQRFNMQWASLVVVLLLISPYANPQDTSLLLVPAVFCIKEFGKKKKFKTLLIGILSIGSLLGFLSTPLAVATRVQITVLFMLGFILMLWYLNKKLYTAPL